MSRGSRLAAVSFPDAVRESGDDPWLRFGVDPARSRCWHDPDAGLLALSRRRPHAGDAGLVLLPTPGAGAAVALQAARPLLEEVSAHWVTLPRALADIAVPALGLAADGVGWEWRWTTQAPPPQPAEPSVVELDGTDPGVVTELNDLLAFSPRHSAEPGSPNVSGWVGVCGGSRLVACAAWVEPVPGIPLLASVAVRPDARRAGLASALSAVILRRALDGGAPAVTVDLYADNDDARRVYTRLGFRLGHAFTSFRR